MTRKKRQHAEAAASTLTPIRPGRSSRRRFIGNLVAAGGALALRPIDLLASTGSTSSGIAGESAADGLPAMSIARWSVDAVPETELAAMATRLTEEAIAAMGGMSRFVESGNVVWIKPNMGWNRAPELAANSNPDVVATLVRLCLAAGAAQVKLGDHTCHDAKRCYKKSGIAKAAKAAGAEIVQLDSRRFKDFDLGGARLDTWPIYPDIVEADVLINVPIAKHHGLSRVSLGMKNLMGAIGGRRNAWHQDLPACLCDITAFLKPELTVLDAVRVLTDHGPQGGNTSDVKRLDTVAASTEIVALDALGCELLGHAPDEIATVQAAVAAGLGTVDYRELALKEVQVG